MKTNQCVDFNSLLSTVSPIEKIAQALDDGTKAKVRKLNSKFNKTASMQQNNSNGNKSNSSDQAIGAAASAGGDAAAAGAVGLGVHTYNQNKKAKKTIKESKKLDKQIRKLKANTIVGKARASFENLKNRLDPARIPSIKKDKLMSKVLENEKHIKSTGKIGVGLAATSLGLNALSGYENNKHNDKTASAEDDDKIRGEVADSVERDSTPKGGAIHRGIEGASIGGIAGLIYGAAKKGRISGKSAKLVRSLWHGTSGAAWGGAGAGGITYAKKSLFPDTEEDKQKEYNKRLEKRAGELDLVSSMLSDKTAVIDMTEGNAKAAVAQRPSLGTVFNPGSRREIRISKNRGPKRSDLVEAAKGKGRADASAIAEKAFINGDSKGKGILGAVRRITSGLTDQKSTVGKFLRKRL